MRPDSLKTLTRGTNQSFQVVFFACKLEGNMMITKRLQKLSAMIIFNSNYLWTYLDWIANMKKTFQFYKAKVGPHSHSHQSAIIAN